MSVLRHEDGDGCCLNSAMNEGFRRWHEDSSFEVGNLACIHFPGPEGSEHGCG